MLGKYIPCMYKGSCITGNSNLAWIIEAMLKLDFLGSNLEHLELENYLKITI